LSEVLDRKQTLRLFHAAFLKAAGYSLVQIEQLGDLAGLSAERLQDLLHGKVEEVLALALTGVKTPKFRLISPKKRKRRKGGR